MAEESAKSATSGVSAEKGCQELPTGAEPSVAPVPPPDPLPERFGRYEIKKKLGQGGMGAVYLARDRQLNRQVALKVPTFTGKNASSIVKRFYREAQASAGLFHRNLCPVHDVGQIDGVHYLTMPFVKGRTLDYFLKSGKKFSVPNALWLVRQMAVGLDVAHRKGIIHRDLKPANIMIDEEGEPVIMDFGLARDPLAECDDELSQAGQLVGTPAYMAPEQVRGDASALGPATDIYSLGVLLYTLLAGRRPFEGKIVGNLLIEIATVVPPPPSTHRPGLVLAVDDLCLRMLGKRPEDRPRSTEELIGLLDDAYQQQAAQTSMEEVDSTDILDLTDEMITRSGAGSTTRLSGLSSRYGVPMLESPSATNVEKNSNSKHASLGRDRRRLLYAGAGGLLCAVGGALGAHYWWKDSSSKTPVASDKNPVTVGILHSLSGTLESSEMPVFEATVLAIEEVNQAGGVLGRKVNYEVRDGQSRGQVFAQKAEELLSDDKIVTVFGCWSSDSRRSVRPIFEARHHLLVYPVQNEGLEESPNIIYTGAAPNQQILPAVKWLNGIMNKRRFFLVGSDYIFPRAANAIIRDELRELRSKGKSVDVVGEAYIRLGDTNVEDVIKAIEKAEPDVIINTINGDTNVAFFRRLRFRGITPDTIPTMSFSIAEHELRTLNTASMVGDFAAWNYFQSIDRPENRQFVKAFRDKYGPLRVVTDPMEAAYFGVHLWAQAVNKAGNTSPSAIRRAFRHQSFDAPEGMVKIDPETQYTYKSVRVGKIRADGQFDIEWAIPNAIKPEPYPATRSRQQWEKFLNALYEKWGKRWANMGGG